MDGKVKGKVTSEGIKSIVDDHDAPQEDSSDNDSTDSEESVYSGLEEESDESDDSGEDGLDDSETDESMESDFEDKEPKSESSNVKDIHLKQSGIEKEESEQSSDEEDLRNTVGNIPMEWYKEFEHIGYNLLGEKIGKPKSGDELDDFLKKMDDPNYWRTVKDAQTGQDVVLSDKDMAFIEKLKKGKYIDMQSDPYAPWIDFFTHEVMQHPLTNHPPQKRSFIPSKYEKLKVGRMVHAIKMGWMKPKEPAKEDEERKYYLLWEQENQSDLTRKQRDHIPAPKLSLPGHAESYNPPPEYLLTEEEELQWKNQESYKRKTDFVPKKYSSLRLVPAYNQFINERFERCLDLYLCPRQRKVKMNVDPEDLIPKLPKPKDLQPFPTVQALMYKGHTGLVRCISVEPSGQWLASGSDDGTVKFWEVSTARCIKTVKVGVVIKDISWSPNSSLSLVAVAADKDILIVNSNLGDKLIVSNTDEMIKSFEEVETDGASGDSNSMWSFNEGYDKAQGYRIKISHPKPVTQISWHERGDYISATMPDGNKLSVMIHQLSKKRSQAPFKKAKGMVQCVRFHPVRPFLFVATQRYVRVYNLLKQELTKKLMTNSKWVSSMAIHPTGDHLIIGSYDCRLSWFDLDLSTKPYQTLRHHKKAIRQVCYHKKYPLFASASDDGTVIVCHGMVYNDLMQNPQIVPVKILRGHQQTAQLGVLDCQFHPTQPWIFSSGSDNTIRPYS